MSKIKTYCYSTFSNNYENSSKGDLLIKDSNNVLTSKHEIKSWGGYTNTLENLIGKQTYNFLLENHKEIIENIFQIIPYEYLTADTNLYVTRNFILTNDYKLYEIKDLDLLYKTTFENEYPRILYNENDLYFLNQSGEYLLFENDSEAILGSTLSKLEYAYVNNNIVFSSSNPKEIYYTETTSIKNLSKNIFQYDRIILPYHTGKILNIINAYDNLFVVCKYGIHIINSENFTIQQTLETSFEIYEGSVSQLEDYIIFFTSCGLFTFDKNNLKQIYNNETLSIKNAKSLIFNNKYYLYNLDFEEYIYEIDLNNNNVSKLKFDNLSNLYLISNNKMHSLVLNLNTFNSYINITINQIDKSIFLSNFITNNINFDSLYQKQIKSLKIFGEGEFEIKIISNCSTYTANCCGDTLLNNINILGSYFILSLTSSNYFIINSLIFEILHLEE